MSKALYDIAYFLEFCDKNGNSLDAFGFSVPPQAEEMEWPNRKTETQTFGGMHVDDYGAGCPRISISGTTGNRTKKKIRRRGSTDEKTGEEEFWELQKLITKYRTGDYLTNGSYIMLTNLLTGKYWRFFPDSLKMSREASMPFVYRYELSGLLTDLNNAVPNSSSDNGRRTSKGGKLSGGGDSWGKSWDDIKNETKDIGVIEKENGKLITKRKTLGEILSAGKEAAKNAKGKVSDALKKVTGTMAQVQDNVNAMLSEVDAYVDLATGTISSVTDVMNSSMDFATSLTPMIAEKLTSIYTDISSSCRSFVDSTKKMCATTLTLLSGEHANMVKEIFTSAGEQEEAAWATTTNVHGNGWAIKALLQAEDTSCESYTQTQSYTPPEPIIDQTPTDTGGTDVEAGGGADTTGGTDSASKSQILLAYGRKDITLKSGDNAEKLAETYFGNADKVQTLLDYNNITSLSDLPVGAKLKVPILDKNKAASRNAIYASSETRDNYGIDIALDDDGCLKVTKTGDFEVMTGTDNLNQAILLRLREGVSKRVRLNAYGIRAVAGNASGLANYVAAQIEQTLFQEPRISSIDGIGLEDAGDYLRVEVKITDINDENITIRGLI